MVKVETLVPGCDYVEDINASARYGAVLPAGIIHNVRYSPQFSTILHAPAPSVEELNCTNSDGIVEGSITATASVDYSAISIDFDHCNLGSFTNQDTELDGLLNLGISGWDQNFSNFDSVKLTASTGTSGLRVTDTNLSQDVTLTLTGFSVSAGEQTQGSPVTIALGHVGLTNHVDPTDNFQLDNCSGVAYTNLTGDSVLDPTACTYTDDDGSFTITSDGGLMLDTLGQVNGSVTITATDSSTMVFTFTDSLGEVDVNLNGEDFGTLDCTAVDTSGLTI